MIYTCTLNPSIDYFIEMDDFKIGELNRIKDDSKRPGGKGINVSRVLKNVGIDSVATGFLGGFTGQFITDSLEQQNIPTNFVQIEGETRINVKLRAQSETEINGQGPFISEGELQLLLNQFNQLKSGDILVLAGSIPSSLSPNLYEEIANRLLEKNIKVIVDATKEMLKGVLPYKPFLIKPNHHELGEIFGVSIHSVSDAIPYGKRLVEMGAEHVIVSMAEKGSLLFVQDRVYYANIPNGKLLNSVGAGDSVVAGFIASYSKNSDVVEAFRFGAAAGSATAYSEGLCAGTKINELLAQVKVEAI
ncbi:1-phosphofructokinase [Fredinandcohnia quinoae]|uniref:Tagatose-6-phosphate kinase n=1 Tax=Fredinandcohnia quinoae TaxID=2918902 RepID=A0AAW5E7N3_9BACI|nr:1-phosphofructokinase [Fredinandcohnia sp. SECRCQ15]MCH1625927.1 1-phosphofructokinase [Fredinandcohnia sp. SECRCQ15]